LAAFFIESGQKIRPKPFLMAGAAVKSAFWPCAAHRCLHWMQTKPMSVPVITIDGPSASGKGTVAAIVAQRLGFHYLDSGSCTACLPCMRASWG
jgi:hypothetical protein